MHPTIRAERQAKAREREAAKVAARKGTRLSSATVTHRGYVPSLPVKSIDRQPRLIETAKGYVPCQTAETRAKASAPAYTFNPNDGSLKHAEDQSRVSASSFATQQELTPKWAQSKVACANNREKKARMMGVRVNAHCGCC